VPGDRDAPLFDQAPIESSLALAQLDAARADGGAGIWVALGALVVVVAALAIVLGVSRAPAVRGAPIEYGLPPVVDAATVEAELQPLRRYLEAKTERPVHFVVARTYQELADGLVSGRFSFAALPPQLYVETKARAPKLELLAAELFDGSRGSDGVLLVLDKSEVRAVSELRGKRLCITDEKSTTGALFPRAALRRAGLDPDRDVTVIESGNHMQLLRDVVDGRCDVGGTFSGAYLTADKAGISVSLLRVLALTGRSPQNAHCSGPDVDEAARARVKAALLALDPRRDTGLDRIGNVERISGFVETPDEEYDEIRAALDDARAARPPAPPPEEGPAPPAADDLSGDR